MESPASTFLRPLRFARGATLLEALVVLAIIAILFGSLGPSFTRFLSDHRASSAANDLVHAIALTRSEALRRGRRVYLAPSGAHWRDGWVIFVDRDDNRRYDAAATGGTDELIARHDALAESTHITLASGSGVEPFTDAGSPPRPYILFDAHGYPRRRNGALNPGALVVTDVGAHGSTVRTICVAAMGRVRVVVDRPSC